MENYYHYYLVYLIGIELILYRLLYCLMVCLRFIAGASGSRPLSNLHRANVRKLCAAAELAGDSDCAIALVCWYISLFKYKGHQ